MGSSIILCILSQTSQANEIRYSYLKSSIWNGTNNHMYSVPPQNFSRCGKGKLYTIDGVTGVTTTGGSIREYGG